MPSGEPQCDARLTEADSFNLQTLRELEVAQACDRSRGPTEAKPTKLSSHIEVIREVFRLRRRVESL
ncbi:hypothetical protein HYALB_00009196 [Hymenoscyphus albidus]|uniref:Uncharacterized protein n=1 Tax=Hymenoscyphus albidus TaxID=595503 RepID=A0A9N9Q2K7_9HELO|nr:hypothetical protein HYALB_00009196 [Hymenoscyphus albidus]